MNRSLIICDRLIYGSLLVMIVFIPYSLMMISVCQGVTAVAWVVSRILLFKTSSRRDFVQSFNFTSSSMFWPLMALVLLIVLTLPFSHDPSLSFKKLGTRFLYQILLMGLVTQVVHSRKRLYSVLAALMLMGFSVIVYSLFQYVWGHNASLIFGRVSGPMHHPNDLGTLLVTILPVIMVLMVTSRCWASPLFRSYQLPGGQLPWMGAAIFVLILFLIGTLGLTASRGAWIAFAVSMIALGACLKRRRVIVCIVLMLTMFFWGFGMYCLNKRVDLYNVPMRHGGPVISPSWINPWGLPAQYNAWGILSGNSGRDLYIDTAIGVIKKYPWFGCGYSAYTQTLKDLHVGHEEYPHNSLLHIAAELGLVGLAFYIWLFVALCMQGWRVLCAVSLERDLYLLGCGISCGILAWMIHSFMDTPWSSVSLSILLWLFIGILLSLDLIVINSKGEKSWL